MLQGKKKLLFMAGIGYGILLCGCGKTPDREVIIEDGMVKTKVPIAFEMTVEELLKEAEIELAEGDEVCDDIAERNVIQVKRHAAVSVQVEGEAETSVEMTGGTVAEAMEQAGVTLAEHDYVNHDINAYLTDGMDIDVTRRLKVTLVADGQKTELLTQAKTVQDFLKEQEVSLGVMDRISPKRTDKLKEGARIKIRRVEKKEVTETEPIEYETITTYSGSMEAGTKKIMAQGENGEKKVTYEVTCVDGKEESREAKSEEIIKQAVAEQVVLGSKPKGKTVVSKQAVYDCDGSGHGYYIIKYSDGSESYKDF